MNKSDKITKYLYITHINYLLFISIRRYKHKPIHRKTDPFHQSQLHPVC